eukprot:6033688-Lingulodinium_polyedra.AAC.1
MPPNQLLLVEIPNGHVTTDDWRWAGPNAGPSDAAGTSAGPAARAPTARSPRGEPRGDCGKP